MERGRADTDGLSRHVTDAAARARRFLEAAQLTNGRWLDFRTRDLISSSWVTAYVGAALAHAGGSRGALEKARTWLGSNRHPRGGWGYGAVTPPDADTIANVIYFLARARGDEPSDPAIVEAVPSLLHYWVEPEGGFQTYQPVRGDPLHYPGSGWCDAHLSVTAMAGEALYAIDKDHHRSILEACSRFLRARQCAAGFWEDYWWDGKTYGTYHAARLLFLMDDRAPVRRSVEWTLEQAAAEGGFGNGEGGAAAPFHTALALRTLLLDEKQGHSHAARSAASWLLREQQSDGGFQAVPMLRVPEPETHAPGESPKSCPLVVDKNRLFTTATVLSALTDYLAVAGA
jgi:squalene-hopene/tetraprenyl-beta-curcumene cyclase